MIWIILYLVIATILFYGVYTENEKQTDQLNLYQIYIFATCWIIMIPLGLLSMLYLSIKGKL